MKKNIDIFSNSTCQDTTTKTEKSTSNTYSDQELVHKNEKENVLMANLSQESGDYKNEFNYEFTSDLIVDLEHSFFFEHERGHIPGLLLIEAARQNGMAIAHKYVNIPLNMSFIMNEFKCEFCGFGSLHKPVKLLGRIIENEIVSKRKIKLSMEAIMIQDNNKILYAKGDFLALPDLVLQRFETSN